MKLRTSRVAAIVAATATIFSALVAAVPANAALVTPTITAVLNSANTVAVTASARTSTSDYIEYQFSTSSSFSSLLPLANTHSAGYYTGKATNNDDTALVASTDGAAISSTDIKLNADITSGPLYVRARELSTSDTVSADNTTISSLTAVAYGASWATKSATVPGAPAKPTLSTASDGKLVATWDQDPDLENNSTYRLGQVSIYDASGLVETIAADSDASNVETATWTGSVVGGKTYYIVAKTRNFLGYSTSSVRSDSVYVPTTNDTIGNVTGLTATPLAAQLGDEGMTFDWVAPTRGFGSVTGYLIQWKTSTSSTWSSKRVADSPVSVVDSTFVAGNAYTIKVTPYNLASSTYTYGRATTLSTTVTSTAAPGVVTGLTPTAGDTKVTLSWTAPSNNGGTAVTHYYVYYGTSATVVSYYAGDAGTATTFTANGLVNGTAYYFRVIPVNANSENSTGTQIGPVTPNPAPDAPATVNAVGGNGFVTVTWTDPTSTHGQTVTDYKVEYKATTGTTWLTYDHPASTSKSLVVNGLVNGTSYTFRVSTVSGTRVSSTATVSTDSPTPSASSGSVSLNPVPSQATQAAGAATVVTNGAVTVPTVLEASNAAKVSNDLFAATFRSLDVTGGVLPADASKHLVIRPSQQVKVVASGFKAYSKVRLYVFSTATLVASGTANSSGSVTLTGKLPSVLAVGAHTLQLNGADEDNNLRSISLGVNAAVAFVSSAKTIKYAFGVSALTSAQKRSLARFNDAQTAVPTVIRVVGFTYGKTSKASLALALARAKAVTKYLKSIGVSATIFTTTNTGRTSVLANARQVVISYFH